MDLSPILLNKGTTDETFQKSEKQEYFTKNLKGSTSMYKVQAHSPLELKLEHNQDPMPLMNQGSSLPF